MCRMADGRLPLFLDLDGKRAVVVGGGEVATRRAVRLAAAGADVVVVAPTVSDELGGLAATVVRREFATSDVGGAWLVLACTDDPAVNEAVAAAAEAARIWCVRADEAESSPAWLPATAHADGITVAVSAGGDPRRAADVRDHVVRALESGEWQVRRRRRDAAHMGGGRVVLVGGGPGDPGLLTLRGYRAMVDADVVVTDRLGPTSLLDALPAEVEVIDVGKTPRGDATSQEEINDLLVRRARAGDVVVRLKGGDPFVLGRGSEEVAACVEAGVEVEVVPGVTSATAAATLAGVPLTRRGTAQQFTVASGHVPPGDPRSTVDWDRLGGGNGTLVLLMAVAHLRAIADALVAAGRAPTTPAVVIENASLPTQRVVRTSLAEVADAADQAAVVPPAIVVIGDVVSDLQDAGGARS
jgi:uroporphyrin-III C-methyltransferase/precorrin-2 dehydrogenase/sirohydrochlorin ferrochelatase